MNSITKPELSIRKAADKDLQGVLSLLQSLSLPTSGVAEHFTHFLIAESHGELVGAIGLELYGETALLRSAAVRHSSQGTGIGERLYTALTAYAKQLGAAEFVLLTTTAERYFSRHGFQTVERASITGAVTQSREFTGACPSTATVMRKQL